MAIAEIRLDPDIHRGTACAKNKIKRSLAFFTVYAAYRPLINVATGRDRAFSSQFGRGRITVRFKKVALGNWGDYKRKKHIHIADAFPNIRSLQQIALPFKKFLFVVFLVAIYIDIHTCYLYAAKMDEGI